NRTAEKRRIQERGDPLRAMVGERIDADFAPGLTPKWSDIIQRQNVAGGFLASAFEIKNDGRGCAAAPGRQSFRKLRWISVLVHGQLHCLRRQEPRSLMMPMPAVHTAPVV